jgi:uncharacterized protein YifE (UPF0438 family)
LTPCQDKNSKKKEKSIVKEWSKHAKRIKTKEKRTLSSQKKKVLLFFFFFSAIALG